MRNRFLLNALPWLVGLAAALAGCDAVQGVYLEACPKQCAEHGLIYDGASISPARGETFCICKLPGGCAQAPGATR